MGNKCRPRKSSDKIEWIVVHYPAMPNRSAYKVKSYFDHTDRAVSTHFIVDENGWLEQTPVDMIAYHVGGLIDHKKLKKICENNREDPPPAWMCSNANSIGIDICDNKTSTKTLSVNDCDWFFSDKTLENAASLIASLMNRYNINIDHVVRHYDVTWKHCPRPFVGNDQSCNHPGVSCSELWIKFKSMIVDNA